MSGGVGTIIGAQLAGVPVTPGAAPYIGQAFPAKVVRESGTTLFHIAARELGDATQWERIARLNGLVDPWITALTELKIPQAGTSNGGIYQG